MYSEVSLSTLINRIGWERPLNSDFAIVINQNNQAATSGRKVNTFHALATVENIYSAVPDVNMDELKFNEFLSSIVAPSVIEVVTAILDGHHLYDDTIDYSNVIIEKARLFDDAIGYGIAIKCLELFISSSRSNLIERNAKLSFQTLKVELEGARNDNGHFIAKGIVYKKERAIQKAQRIIFPDPVLVIGSGNEW
jgi:hypothetical protein